MYNSFRSRKDKTEYENKVVEYWKEARKYVKTISDDLEKPDWFSFEYDDEARWKWELYFNWRLGFMPRGLFYLKSGTINEFLVPCEKPEDFDSNYKPIKKSASD